MVCSYDMDLTMLKELAAEGVFRVKPNTRGKGAAWARIVNHLNQLKEFTVTPKALRDRFKTLSDKLKAKLAKEKKEVEEAKHTKQRWKSCWKTL